MKFVTTKAIVLKRTKLNDKYYIELFTENSGKINILLSKKTPKKINHLLQPLFTVEVVLFFNEKKQNYYLNQAHILNSFPFDVSYEKLQQGLFLIELIRKTTFPSVKQNLIFRLYNKALIMLSKFDDIFELISIYVMLHHLNLAGLLQDITRCGLCNKKFDNLEPSFLISNSELFVCKSCCAKSKIIFKITPRERNFLISLLKFPILKIHTVELKNINTKKLFNVFIHLFRFHFEFKSKIINTLN